MNRLPLILVLLIMITASGCSGLLGDESTPGPETVPDRTEETVAVTTTNASVQSNTSLFSSSTETSQLLIVLADLGPDYNYSGESVKIRENASGDKEDELSKSGVLRKHRKVFTLENPDMFGSEPMVIISLVTVYESTNVAKKKFHDDMNSFESSGANVTQAELASGITSIAVRENTSNGKTILTLWGRESNLIFSISVLGQENFHRSQAEKLYLKMLADIRSYKA